VRALHDRARFVAHLEQTRRIELQELEVRDEARAIVEGTHPRGEYLRDLVVYERYHENLLAAVEAFLAGELKVPPAQENDPDIVFAAYLRWCARQPTTPAETWRAFREGRFTIDRGLVDEPTSPAAVEARAVA